MSANLVDCYHRPGSGLQLTAGLRYDPTAMLTPAGWPLATARVTLLWQQPARSACEPRPTAVIAPTPDVTLLASAP